MLCTILVGLRALLEMLVVYGHGRERKVLCMMYTEFEEAV